MRNLVLKLYLFLVFFFPQDLSQHSLLQTREGEMKGKAREKGLLMKLGKEIGARRDSEAHGSAFIMPLPPDPRAMLDGRARLLGMALLICHSWGKWLLMKGLKWHMEKAGPGADAWGFCSICVSQELCPTGLPVLGFRTECHGCSWPPSQGIILCFCFPSPRFWAGS